MFEEDKKDPFAVEWFQRKLPNGGGSWAAWNKPREPERVYIQKDSWPAPKERTDKIFAKSCTADPAKPGRTTPK